MKRLVLFLVVVLGVSIATPIFAVPTIKMTNGAYGTTRGGEFNVEVISGAVGPYSESETFYTFCVESSEIINLNGFYDVLISNAAIYNSAGPYNADPLDPRTAYLFTEYVSGGLGTRTDFLANDFQRAIWCIEEESGGVDNYLVAQANTAILPGGQWYEMGLGNVRVMNLFRQGHVGEYSYRGQDQLVIIPVPGAVLLGSIGIVFVGWLRRRRAL